MTLLWLVQLRTRNAGVVDIAWAATIGLLGAWFAATSTGDATRRLLAAALIVLWSVRLTVYLWRRVVGHPEEGRYASLRRRWGRQANLKMFMFFQMQAAAATFFALPILVASHDPTAPLIGRDLVAVAIWMIGMGGVSLADWQLAQFRRRDDARGRTCRLGLWRYSRHPNYFFEWIVWWAYVPLSLGTPWWPVAAAVPLALLVFLLFITGIPPTEAQALASRGDDYRRYQQTTSAFVPWFPRRSSEDEG